MTSNLAILQGETSKLIISALILNGVNEGHGTLHINLTYTSKDDVLEITEHASLMSDAIYDLLDIAICAHAMAHREDTTEELRIPEYSSYQHRAQGAIYQSFFGCDFLFCSKNTARFRGKRVVDFICYQHGTSPACDRIVRVVSSPEALLAFSTDILSIYNKIQSSLSHHL